jgi:hypothetical protein
MTIMAESGGMPRLYLFRGGHARLLGQTQTGAPRSLEISGRTRQILIAAKSVIQRSGVISG